MRTDSKLLKSYILQKGDTQKILAEAMGLSLSRLNQKINNSDNAEFTQSEIWFIVERYDLSEQEMNMIFFA